ncbi:peptide ABC transporter substrate-binding protein [Phocicoccus pinnipedialis]|uniref:Periplasmic dipeptide transport protein n=1 Tax=Phocicoccus pinnipedialis TaxID=110845 RepID=A0A6V7R4P3_9BACL|nr:peptide ABC transporter substrate-binding protein [Jeotgalicoccus pinnipedialis]MBP1939738.1 oligopeptide transport system substrate-binding protein [Jeotgalicoccus pinnipedialis]CAD2072360.1 Periplasmic dipeptide transport protein precursor [Jeotgalicoccus pinnipedialis]
MKKLGTLLLLLVSGIVLAACNFGGGGDADKSEDGEAMKELNVSITSDPPAFHPALATDTTSGAILASAFEGLTRLDAKGEPTEGMAEKVEVSEDGKTYTYTLRDAKWSNGDSVIAEDFVYAWKWALDPENAADYAYQLYYIVGAEEYNNGEGSADDVGVKALDEKTLEVTLVNPTPFFDELTAFYTYFPVNSKLAEENPDWYKDPSGDDFVGNGPFNLDEFASADHITLSKNDNYWDKDNVALDKVNISMIESEATALKEYQAGNLDYLGAPFNTIDLNALDGFKEDGTLNVSDQAGTYMIVFNTKDDILGNKNIREALTTAIDRDGLIENVTKGEQKPGSGLVPLTMTGFEEPADYFKSNDIDAAKAALDKGLEELGLDKPSDLKIKLSYNTSEAHAAIMQFIQQGWAKNLGIDVSLDNSEWQVYLEQLDAGEYQAGRYGWVGDFNDPINFLEIFKRDGGNNQTGWTNKEYTDLLNQAATETDEAARTQNLKDAEEIFMKDFPIAPIYFYTNLSVKQDGVKNMESDPMGNVQLKYVDIEK